jgi:SAM-dependent methyltransferase
MSTTPLPWSFESLARDNLPTSCRALELGTGGGERLALLLGDARGAVVATEGYAPNLPFARARLQPLGVPVIASNAIDLPFRDARFDLVMSRRTGFAASEVARVLMPAGQLLTEQVVASIGPELGKVFGQPSSPAFDLTAQLLARCQAADLRIVRVETADVQISFSDLGALVSLLRAMPWIVPGFAVDDYVGPLLALQEQVENDGMLTLPQRMCLLIARRAADVRADHRK